MNLPDWSRLTAFARQTVVYGNGVDRWLVAIAIAVAVALALRVIKSVLRRRAAKTAAEQRTEWFLILADLVGRTRWWFQLILALYVGSLALVLPVRVADAVESVAVVTLLVQTAIWAGALISAAVDHYARRREADASSVTTISALGFLGKLATWTLIFLLILDNAGVNVTAMIAGLGIGGIAVGLAAQNILADLFASASIVLDKPFVLGDFIVVGPDMGTVEHIGLKTTRLKSLAGEQLIFSNNELLKSRILNAKRMRDRRVAFTIGVVYETPYEKLAAIPGMLREIVEANEKIRFDRAHFKQYGDFALIFEVVYVVLDPDHNLYMEIQQAINLAIFSRFKEEGIKFAYPTRTVHVAWDSVPSKESP
jgi:small-conductance mechanosensitive channel